MISPIVIKNTVRTRNTAKTEPAKSGSQSSLNPKRKISYKTWSSPTKMSGAIIRILYAYFPVRAMYVNPLWLIIA